MVREEVSQKIRQLADEVSAREGCELYDVTIVRGGGKPTVRVYIDRKPGGVSLEDCAAVSRALSLLLDVEQMVDFGSYDLEVSSPGLERPLLRPCHFQWAMGERAEVKIQGAELVRGERPTKIPGSLRGLIGEAGESNFLLSEESGRTWRVAYEDVRRAHLIFEMDRKKKKR